MNENELNPQNKNTPEPAELAENMSYPRSNTDEEELRRHAAMLGVYAGPETASMRMVYGGPQMMSPQSALNAPLSAREEAKRRGRSRIFTPTMCVYAGPDYWNPKPRPEGYAAGPDITPPAPAKREEPPVLPEGKTFCPVCGAQVNIGQKFCQECGNRLPREL